MAFVYTHLPTVTSSPRHKFGLRHCAQIARFGRGIPSRGSPESAHNLLFVRVKKSDLGGFLGAMGGHHAARAPLSLGYAWGSELLSAALC